MGTTFSSIHIYSTESVTLRNCSFQCFSQGWHTFLTGDDDFSDPEASQKAAKSISKSVEAPVLWFCILDGDYLSIKFYLRGKHVAGYSDNGIAANKNLSRIPQLIGYEDDSKRRLSKIFGCSDVDFKIKLLEEFFGVCLLPFPELAEEDIQALLRTRGDKLYKEYITAEKEMTGKCAAIQAELVQELEGLLDNSGWDHEWFDKKQFRNLPFFKSHYYLHFKARITGIERVPVYFHDGKVQFISHEEMKRDGADKPYPRRYIGDNPNYEHAFHPAKLIFADTAPAVYRGKEMLLPHGLYGLGFDLKERLVLYDCKSTFAIVDESMKVIAKQRLKGNIKDIDGDYILTMEERGILGFIRVYRIFDK